MPFANYNNIHDELVGFCNEHKIVIPPCLIAVSKTVGIEEVQEAILQGAHDFGENRPEELVKKASAIKGANWHFIGNIQSRQIKNIVPYATLIHSLFDISHAVKINKIAGDIGKVQNVLVEANVSGEVSKSGVSKDDLEEFLKACSTFERIHVAGLMTMAPKVSISSDASSNLPTPFETFSRLKELANKFSLKELSMGMSDDWQDGILAGSTYVRIGRAIFDKNYTPA